MNNEIIIYQNQQNETEVQVRFEGDTFWLSQRLMAVLFDKDSDTIGLHLRNIYEELELDELATTEFFSVVQIEGKREVTRKIKHYNLDAILSVGYRVNSKRGTQFRQWATARLKDFLKGYAINQKRLDELSQMVSIIAQSTQSDNLKFNEAKGLLNVLSNYTQSYILLNQFDNHSLKTDNLNENVTYKIKYEEAKPQIDALKQKLIDLKEATALFGKEKDDSFRGILGNVLQTYDGQYLYPSIEE